MSQITLRDLPAPVEEHLRARAEIEGRSLSKVASELLAESLGLKEGRRDLSKFSGLWSAEERAIFDRSVAAFDEIDMELWD
jgi:plasmid stability protein